MSFNVQLESISTNNINMEFFYVPWDSDIFNRKIAQISKFKILDSEKAANDYELYQKWCEKNKIEFSSCKLLHGQVNEGLFLQNKGFKFIELNYHPFFNNLALLKLPASNIEIQKAEDCDEKLLADVAETIFHNERFHKDPCVETELANKRYRIWVENAFKQEHQKVLKCILNNQVIAFFVVEYPEPAQCFWSLVGMLPEFQGKGLGKQVWQAMLKYHQQEAISTVSTSISSHNVPVFNLYVALGFRFPEPFITLHCLHNKA